MASKPLKIEFFAYLPPIESAILISGNGDNMQVKLSIPINISPDGLRMSSMTGKRLRVTVEEVPEKPNDQKQTDTRPRASRRNPLYAPKAK